MTTPHVDTDLSPAAQAVLDAVEDHGKFSYSNLAAAALRAVADQGENLYDPHEGKASVVRVEHLLTVANELEAK